MTMIRTLENDLRSRRAKQDRGLPTGIPASEITFPTNDNKPTVRLRRKTKSSDSILFPCGIRLFGLEVEVKVESKLCPSQSA
jgi:hypothetical protein